MKAILQLATAALAATTLVAPCALADAGAGGSTPPPTEGVSIAACHADPAQANRYATFAAQMTAVRGTEQMWVRFELLEQLPGASAFHLAAAPGLGVWQKSTPGIALFRYSQEVASLPAPGAYRARVSFRWYGARHRLLRRTRRATPACSMPPEQG